MIWHQKLYLRTQLWSLMNTLYWSTESSIGNTAGISSFGQDDENMVFFVFCVEISCKKTVFASAKLR